jgi:hypothetical protein
MKKYLLWSFERGSRAYDVICIVILAFIFLTPHTFFHDRPDLKRVISDQAICRTLDDDGLPVYFVEVRTERDAVDRLKACGETAKIARTEPVYNAAGQVVAYRIWIQR